MLFASWKQPRLHAPHISWCAAVGGGERRFHECQPILPLTEKAWGGWSSLFFSSPFLPLLLLGFYFFSPNHIIFHVLEVLGNLSQATEKQTLSLGSSGENPRTSRPFVEFVLPHGKLRSPLSHHSHLSRFLPAGNFKLQRPGMLTLVCCTRAPVAGYGGGKVP